MLLPNVIMMMKAIVCSVLSSGVDWELEFVYVVVKTFENSVALVSFG